MHILEKVLCLIFWGIAIALVAVCYYQTGTIETLKKGLQADRELIQSLYQQIATTEMFCDMEIEKAQVSCVD